MKTLARAALAVLASVLAPANFAAAETRPVPVRQLLSIDVSGPFRVEITTGPQTSVVLEGPAPALALVDARVRGTRLQVRARNALFVSRKDDIEAVVRITAPIVQAISVSKGAQAVATDLNTHTLTLNVSMGGTLTASGRCDDLVARSQMGGVLDGKSLVCRDVIANASMGGAAQVHATQSIVANAAMGGTIDVTGAPARRDATAFMGGMIGQDD